MATGSLPVSSYSAQLDQPVTIRLRHDSDLIAGLDDCHRQFGALYQRGWPLVWIAARARLDCDADADDVAQRVFPRRGPALVGDALAGEVDDRVDAVEMPRQRAGAPIGLPGNLVAGG